MFCKYCGNELPDGTKFCNACGANLAVDDTPVEPEAERIAPEAAPEVEIDATVRVNNTSVPVDQSAFENSAAPVDGIAPELPEDMQASDESVAAAQKKVKKVKKSKKKLLIGLIAAVVALAAIASSIIFIPKLREKFTDLIVTFSSPEKQQLYAYKKAATKLVDNVNETVNSFKSIENIGNKSQMTIKLGNTAKELLSELDPTFGTFDSVTIDSDFNVDQTVGSFDLGLSYNGEKLISAETVVDIDDLVVTVAVPELSDKAIKIDLEEMIDEDELDEFNASYSELNYQINEITKLLPDEKLAKELVLKYLEVALKSIDGVEKKKDTLEVGDVKVKATVLSTEFTEKMLNECFAEVLKEVKNDKDLKKHIISVYGDDGEKKYEELVKEIDSMLKDIKNDPGSKDTLFTLKTWVNGSFEILAVEISADDTVITYANVENKDKTAAEISVEVDGEVYFSIKAEGTKKRDVYSGKVNVSYMGESVLNIKYSDVDKSAEGFAGKLTFSSKKLNEIIPSEFASLAELTVEGKVDGKKQTVILGVGTKSAQLGTVTIVNEPHDFKKITLHNDAVTDPEEWANSIDISAVLSLKNKLEENGLMDIYNAIYELYNDYSYDDDYYDDDYYDDDYYDDDYYDDNYYDDYDYYDGYDSYDYFSNDYSDGYLAGFYDGYTDGAYGDHLDSYGAGAEGSSDEYAEGYSEGYDEGYEFGYEYGRDSEASAA